MATEKAQVARQSLVSMLMGIHRGRTTITSQACGFAAIRTGSIGYQDDGRRRLCVCQSIARELRVPAGMSDRVH